MDDDARIPWFHAQWIVLSLVIALEGIYFLGPLADPGLREDIIVGQSAVTNVLRGVLAYAFGPGLAASLFANQMILLARPTRTVLRGERALLLTEFALIAGCLTIGIWTEWTTPFLVLLLACTVVAIVNCGALSQGTRALRDLAVGSGRR